MSYETLEFTLDRISTACATKPKRHAELVDAIAQLKASIADGTFDALGAAREGEPTSAEGGRATVALREAQVDAILPALRAAAESGSALVIASAMSAFQHLIARGLVVGRAGGEGEAVEDARSPPPKAPSASEPSASDASTEIDGNLARTVSVSELESDDGRNGAASTAPKNPAREIIDTICTAAETRDESVELQVLQTLLTAVSSRTFEVHDRALLRAVRTCYNVYLSSKSEVNQNTAKATLTQMLTTVFHRLETDDPHASAPTIVVADLLRPIGSDDDFDSTSTMSNFVQSFVNKVSVDINSVGSFSYFADPDAVVKTEAVEDEITQSEFDNDTAPMTPTRGLVVTLDTFSPGVEKDLEATSSQLETDAYLVFRSLCKLAKKPSGEINGTALVRSKILSLQLLKIIIENAGDAFSSSARFTNVVREYLCDAIVSNATPSVAEAYQLSCSIFLTLLTRYRSYLKAEIGFFFPMLLLKPLELQEGEPLIAYNQRATLVKGFQVLCTDAQLLVDLFVNFDCDLDGQNVFERYVSSLVRIAQGADIGQVSGVEAARESVLKIEALECLTAMLASMNAWVETNLDQGPSTSGANDNADDDTDAGFATPLKTSASAESKLGESIAKLKADKQEFQEGIALFNKKAKKGLEFLQSIGRLGKSHAEIAEFLRTTPGLDKTVVGDYLGERDEPMLAVMHAYVDALDFTSLTLDDAIRKFLEGFRLPGESQKIDRLMEKFAERYHKLNPTVYKSADTAYVLAFSVIMLNTDAHNPQVKNKMTKEGFIRNNRGIDDGQDLPKEILEDLYDRIVNNEIKMKEPAEAALGATEKKDKNNLSHRLGMDVLFSLMSGKREEELLQIDTSELIDQVRARAATTKGFLVVSEAGCAKPMLEVISTPILSVLGKAFEDSESVAVVSNCLEGFRRAINLTTLLGMHETRSTFITPLSRLTFLHNPQMMRSKNVMAMKTLIRVSVDNGNDFGQVWTLILSCVSRYEHVYSLANGFDDSSLFLDATHAVENQTQNTRPRLFRRSTLGGGRSTKSPSSARGDDANGVIEAANEAANEAAEVYEELIPPDRAVLEQLSPDEIGHIYHASVNLNGDAIVDFVRSLCELAIDETSSTHPRVYALGKIVEVASFNMDRIRFIWARVWQVLSDFFVTVGCSPNLHISMTVVDSLRQLAMKFLSRTELSNYSFQNEFLRPFVVVMRQSPDVEIRELIIRCVSQMVQARVEHIKSGWKSMFMVFTTAAADERSQIVVLAFQTIERIIREHFHYIIETDTVAFTDCVNCLVAFTNSEAGSEVCLNALAFLRFCALKLAEGALGDLEETAATEKQLAADGVVESTPTRTAVATTCFTDADAHTYFWFPLLAGLSELTFDPRSEIRTSALEVLFDTLKFHGGSFASGFWKRVYSRILFPIFDHVRADIAPQRLSNGGDDDDVHAVADIDDWLYGTCTRCLELVVDLAVQFHEPIVEAGVMPELLDLLCGLTSRTHEQLAACGVVAFRRLLVHGAAAMRAREWSLCMNALKGAFESTAPDFSVFNGDMSDDETAANASLVRVKTQLLLVSAARDLSTEHASARERFNDDTLFVLLDILESVYAKAVESPFAALDVDASHVPQIVRSAKPFALALEVGSASIALRALARLQAKSSERMPQLIRLSRAAMDNYLKLFEIHSGADLREDARVRAQICVDALDAARALSQDDFKAHVHVLYPLFTALIRCEGSPCELTNSLCDLFTERVGPMLARSQ